MPEDLITLSKHACFGGAVSFHEHCSETRDATMRFAVYAPPQAAEHGLMLVAPDTSPRDLDLPDEDDDWDREGILVERAKPP